MVPPQVGNTPGVTKAVQEVHLDKQVTLLDSPGVVFAAAGADGEAAAALRNCVKVRWRAGGGVTSLRDSCASTSGTSMRPLQPSPKHSVWLKPAQTIQCNVLTM